MNVNSQEQPDNNLLAAQEWQRQFGGHIVGSDDDIWVVNYTSSGGNRLSCRFIDGRATPPKDTPRGHKSKVADNDNNPGAINLTDWKASRFVGEPQPVEYLVEGVIPLGVPGMVAAMGDTGKSFALLELHRRISFGSSPLAGNIFGGHVSREGTTVMLTSEDDTNEVHRRLAALDHKSERLTAKGERLMVVPLPSINGPVAFWKQDKTGLAATDDFRRVQDQLLELPDLALVTIDPLASFAHLAINEDPMAGQFVCSSMAALASATGATVLTAHHMRKAQKAVTNLSEARDAIRGSTALVDGLRLVYAMWPAEPDAARNVCRWLGVPYEAGKVVFGGVVKANGPARRAMATYVRSDFGCWSTARQAWAPQRRTKAISYPRWLRPSRRRRLPASRIPRLAPTGCSRRSHASRPSFPG